MQRDMTRVCVLTPRGRGAVAVVAVAGDEATRAAGRYFQAANGRLLAEQPLRRIVYGHWGGSTEEAVTKNGSEDLIVCRREDRELEIHCHGGHQSSAQIVSDLTDAGCTLVSPEEWLVCRAESPIATAAQLALAEATTFRTATILLDQYYGALQDEVEAIVSADLDEAGQRLESLLQYATLGIHLAKPWRVVIAGQPNVGKSSLINALVGYERAIVFDQPGTTRDVVASTTAIEGWPVELSDTAGLHDTTHTIESAGIALARNQLFAADLVVWVLDAVAVASANSPSSWELAQRQAGEVGVTLDQKNTQLVINKTDLVDMFSAEEPQTVCTCAVSGQGLEQLLAAIARRLVPNAPAERVAVPFTEQQIEQLNEAQHAIDRKDLGGARDALQAMLLR